MTPFIFIGTHTLKQGKFDDFAANCAALAELVEAEEPRMIAFNVYANEDGTEVSVVQVHPDAESMLSTCRSFGGTSPRRTPTRWRRRRACLCSARPTTTFSG